MYIEVEGVVDRITFRNEDNKYTVLKLKAGERSEPLNVVGNILSISPGETLKIKGMWEHHPRFGPQLKVVEYETVTPETESGIEKYLASGLIRGIGPVTAKKIVQKFGAHALEILDADIDRLREVEGIGQGKLEGIKRSWASQREIKGIMVFLQGHDISVTQASKIYRKYGSASIRVLKENPYRLATDIHGIGFITADRIAEKLGIPKDSELRAAAGILYVLQKQSESGNVFCPYEELLTACTGELGIGREQLVKAFAALVTEKAVVVEGMEGDEPRENEKSVYIPWLYFSEAGIARMLQDLMNSPKGLRIKTDPDPAISACEQDLSISLSAEQKDAVRSALTEKVLVITGGPGVGKTTVIRAVIGLFKRLGAITLLAAPTGRAAKRMSELTGQEAKTIHRLLEWSPSDGKFRRNEQFPLVADLVVVDETSMVDTGLMHSLLKALPRDASLVLVGDVDQIPSVGPGNVLRDIINSGRVPTVRMNEIFRQSDDSLITVNAHRVNHGELPIMRSSSEKGDFKFIECRNPEDALTEILDMVGKTLPETRSANPVTDIQVITPMHKGVIGVGNLNRSLQGLLNPNGIELVREGKRFRSGDKVMQMRNNYDKDVYNGDMGRILRMDPEAGEVYVDFYGRHIRYELSELEEITPAYAITVHKSQGSEYPIVIIPIFTEHFMLLQRNLLYTAITRGKELVVIIGSRRALSMAVRNDKTQQRYTGLQRKLANIQGF